MPWGWKLICGLKNSSWAIRASTCSGGELGQMIETYIKEGKIVPAAVTVGLLRRAMEESGKRKFLVDGFPRNTENLFVWLEVGRRASVCAYIRMCNYVGRFA